MGVITKARVRARARVRVRVRVGARVRVGLTRFKPDVPLNKTYDEREG